MGEGLYHEKAEESYNIYHLIDGLQRSTSIKSYVENPTKFYSEEYLDAEFIKSITSFLASTTSIDKIPDEQAVKNLLVNWIQLLKGFSESDGFSSFELANKIDASVDNTLSKETLSELARVLPKHLKKLGDESDISKVRVPVIIYSGEQSNLPEIFERMNSKGTQLSKYQIFAATWSTYPAVKIDNRKIIDQIKGKYEALVDEGLEVNNFDPSNFYTAKFNYFEYLFGLGKHLTEIFPLLFGEISNRDQTESIGFNLSAICLGHNLKQMGHLPHKLDEIELAKFETSLLNSIKIVNEILKPFISLRANAKNGKVIPTCHTEFQIASIIGKVFKSKYSSILEVSDEWKQKEKNLKDNIPLHYLYDILRNYWSGTGDTKAEELSYSNKYETPLTYESWDVALDEWHQGEKDKREKVRVRIRPQTILFFKYIYTYLLSAYDELSSIEFEIEHICPVSRLKDLMKINENNDGLPIGAVSNLCLIEKSLNRDKGDKTIYEFYDDQLTNEELTESQMLDELRKVEERSITIRKDLEFLTDLDRRDLDSYDTFLNNRYQKLKKVFFAKNGISASNKLVRL